MPSRRCDAAPAATTAARRARRRPPRRRAPEQRADEDVVLVGVPELVAHDERDLLGRRPLDERVVQHDAPAAAEAAHVRVQRRRPARGVGDEHVVDGHAVLLGERQHLRPERPVGQGGEGVEDGSTTSG
jgi:hypothetical protein